MSRPSAIEIAGYPAARADLTLEVGSGSSRTIALWAVDDLERFVDVERLLREWDSPDPPYWALVWTGAVTLARALLEQPPGPGAEVLDLGCGLGVVGLAAALGGARVTFADLEAPALEFVRANAALNGVRELEAVRLDFCRDRLDRRFELIAGADIVYDPTFHAPLNDFLDAHLAPGGTALFSDSLRSDGRGFFARLRERGWTEEVHECREEDGGRPLVTWLHRLRPPGAEPRFSIPGEGGMTGP